MQNGYGFKMQKVCIDVKKLNSMRWSRKSRCTSLKRFLPLGRRSVSSGPHLRSLYNGLLKLLVLVLYASRKSFTPQWLLWNALHFTIDSGTPDAFWYQNQCNQLLCLCNDKHLENALKRNLTKNMLKLAFLPFCASLDLNTLNLWCAPSQERGHLLRLAAAGLVCC